MTNIFSKLTIKSKVVISTIIAVLSVISLVGYYSFNSSWNILLDNTFEKELPAILGEVNNDLNSKLEAPIIASKTMAISPLFTEYQDDTSTEYIVRYLKDMKKQFNAITSYYVSSVDGSYYIPDGIFRVMSKDNADDQWFYNTLKDPKPYSFNFDTDQSNGVPTMFVNYEVVVDGKKQGIAGIGLTLESVSKIIQDYRIGESGIVYLVDKEGKIRIHPDQNQIGKNINELSEDSLTELLNKKDTVIKEVNINGDIDVIGAKEIESLGWTVFAQIPRTEVLGELNSFGGTLFFIAVIIAAIFIPLSIFFIKKLLSPFEEVGVLLEEIGQGGGDLTRRLDDSREDEVGRIAKGYNNFVETLTVLLKNVEQTEKGIISIANDLNTVSTTMENDVREQSSQIEQIATAIHEMGASSQDIAQNANSAADSSAKATEALMIGQESVVSTSKSVDQMNEQMKVTQSVVQQLSEDTQAITKVLSVITGVSEQTNLLALNAAIEAARAGEAGRGFAVVADEVRTLAARSNESAEEIKSIIDKLQTRTTEVVQAIEENSSLAISCQEEAKNSEIQLNNISDNITIMNDENTQIASATTQQSHVVGEISPRVTEVSEIAKSIEMVAEETTEECQRLLKESKKLTEMLGRFKF
jgi:methyl-accepting chemotaxis protein